MKTNATNPLDLPRETLYNIPMTPLDDNIDTLIYLAHRFNSNREQWHGWTTYAAFWTIGLTWAYMIWLGRRQWREWRSSR